MTLISYLANTILVAYADGVLQCVRELTARLLQCHQGSLLLFGLVFLPTLLYRYGNRTEEVCVMVCRLDCKAVQICRVCHLIGADFEQAMRTLHNGGDEAAEILLIIENLPAMDRQK